MSRRAILPVPAFSGALFGFVFVAAIGFAAPAPKTGATTGETPKLAVGPNVLVSRDGDVPHVELMLATSPRNSDHLLGGAITFTKPTGGTACRAYSSRDGGMTWKATEFAEQAEWGGGDPQVAFSAQGTGLFVALTLNKSDAGKGCASMHVWRTEDGGSTWEPPSEIPCDPSWDHEQIVVDTTKGRFANRIYIAALYGYPVYRIGVFRSDDDGRSWTGPVEAANGGGTLGINDVTPVVLSDGTLVVPYVDFQFLPDKRPSKGKAPGGVWTAASTDGGVSFSAPRKAFTQEHVVDNSNTTLGLAGFPKFAADTDSSKYRDRIYAVWEDSRLGSYRILTSWSADAGRTWSAPRPVDGRVAASVHQFQPAVAVNGDGVVAVTWFDTRHSDGRLYDQFIAASFDGGASFAPPVRVSSASSDPRGPGNRRQITPMSMTWKERVVLSFLSAAGWTAGGHYMGLAADRGGDFHPFWVDARNGTSQIYTARVRVAAPATNAASKDGAMAPAASKPGGAGREPVSIVDKVELLFDPVSFDPAANELSVPIRLKNVSSVAIHPPLAIRFVGFGSGEEESDQEKDFWKTRSVSILDAPGGAAGDGAVFSFDQALAGSDTLEPGAQTNPVVLRLKLSDPFYAPSMRWDVTGRLSNP